jgi:peptidoglycan/LPS O-acetylase OafA/YrhL
MGNDVTTEDSGRPQAVLALEVVSIGLFLAEIILGSVAQGWAIAAEIAVSLVFLWLAFMVTRKRSALARWALTAVFLFGIALTLYALVANPAFADFSQMTLTASIGIWALSAVQMALLWTRDVSRWVAAPGPERTEA